MGKELDIDDVAAGHPMAQAYLSGMRAEAERLRVENATFRNAKLACEHCDPAGHAAAVASELERWMKASTAALEILDDLPAWSNAGHACQLLREALGPNVGNNRPEGSG